MTPAMPPSVGIIFALFEIPLPTCLPRIRSWWPFGTSIMETCASWARATLTIPFLVLSWISLTLTE